MVRSKTVSYELAGVGDTNRRRESDASCRRRPPVRRDQLRRLRTSIRLSHRVVGKVLRSVLPAQRQTKRQSAAEEWRRRGVFQEARLRHFA